MYLSMSILSKLKDESARVLRAEVRRPVRVPFLRRNFGLVSSFRYSRWSPRPFGANVRAILRGLILRTFRRAARLCLKVTLLSACYTSLLGGQICPYGSYCAPSGLKRLVFLYKIKTTTGWLKLAPNAPTLSAFSNGCFSGSTAIVPFYSGFFIEPGSFAAHFSSCRWCLQRYHLQSHLRRTTLYTNEDTSTLKYDTSLPLRGPKGKYDTSRENTKNHYITLRAFHSNYSSMEVPQSTKDGEAALTGFPKARFALTHLFWPFRGYKGPKGRLFPRRGDQRGLRSTSPGGVQSLKNELRSASARLRTLSSIIIVLVKTQLTVCQVLPKGPEVQFYAPHRQSVLGAQRTGALRYRCTSVKPLFLHKPLRSVHSKAKYTLNPIGVTALQEEVRKRPKADHKQPYFPLALYTGGPAVFHVILKEAKIRTIWFLLCFIFTGVSCYWFSEELLFILVKPFLSICQSLRISHLSYAVLSAQRAGPDLGTAAAHLKVRSIAEAGSEETAKLCAPFRVPLGLSHEGEVRTGANVSSQIQPVNHQRVADEARETEDDSLKGLLLGKDVYTLDQGDFVSNLLAQMYPLRNEAFLGQNPLTLYTGSNKELHSAPLYSLESDNYSSEERASRLEAGSPLGLPTPVYKVKGLVGLLGGQSVRRSADAQQTIQVHALKEEGAQHLHLASGGERWNILEEPNVSFISTQLTETLNTYITSILILSCVFSAPNIIYQLWCFLIPSCNSTQRMRLNQICVLSGLAFVCMLSVSFAYIMPNIWYFLLTCGQSSTNQFCIQLQPKIYDFIILTMRFLFCASICSQVPVILIILMEYNIISIQNCIKHRGIFFFCSLCIAAFITPPDLLCQLATSYGLYTCVELTLFYELVRLHYNDIFLALEQTPDINN